MNILPRFRPNRVRPEEDPELVTSRNLDGIADTLQKAFTAVESAISDIGKALANKANATNPVLRGLLTILGGVTDLSMLSVTGNLTLTSANGTIMGDATAASFTITLPPAATSKGVQYQIYKVDASANTITIDGNASETIGGATTVVLGGNVGISRLFIICDGANWQIRELYEEGTYTATLTGCTTSPTQTVSYVKNGKSVVLRMSTLSATSNTTACTITGMPSHLWPATGSNICVESVMDNSLEHPGLVAISAAGVWLLYFYSALTTQTNTFTNVGTKGVGNLDMAFTLQ